MTYPAKRLPRCAACDSDTVPRALTAQDSHDMGLRPEVAAFVIVCNRCREDIRNQTGPGWQWLQRMKETT